MKIKFVLFAFFGEFFKIGSYNLSQSKNFEKNHWQEVGSKTINSVHLYSLLWHV